MWVTVSLRSISRAVYRGWTAILSSNFRGDAFTSAVSG